jgi:hypothetical protein
MKQTAQDSTTKVDRINIGVLPETTKEILPHWLTEEVWTTYLEIQRY